MAQIPYLPNNATQWSFKTQHVQPEDVVNSDGSLKNFISAESVILAAGPAIVPSDLSTLMPIGLCDSASVQQNKNLVQLFELGSKIPYIFPGRTFIQLSLNRVMFNGNSLMGAMTFLNSPTTDDGTGTASDMPGHPVVNTITGKTPEVGSGNFYLNLASSFFDQPFGLGLLIQDNTNSTGQTYDQQGTWVAGYYFENCMIQNHQFALQGQQYIITETALVRCTNMSVMDMALQ